MKHIYLNLKRFDIPKGKGGVNSIASVADWAPFIIKHIQSGLLTYKGECDFTVFFPEAHILGAASALDKNCPLTLGCQGVYREDVAVGGNFGAFTSSSPATAMAALGAGAALIGHCEERKSLMATMLEGGANSAEATKAVNRILNAELKKAVAAGLSVLYCIGESSEEQSRWQDVLQEQIEQGLMGLTDAEKAMVALAYEPVWAIGPGKTPPDKEYISKIAAFVKQISAGMPLSYGGGLKTDNAAMLASIADIDGGLIALTRFSGDIGFYPEEFLEIVRTYLNK